MAQRSCSWKIPGKVFHFFTSSAFLLHLHHTHFWSSWQELPRTTALGNKQNRDAAIWSYAFINPFAKEKKPTHNNPQKTTLAWILSKLSATMEIENHLGKKMLHYIYWYFSQSAVWSSRDSGRTSSHGLRAAQSILWDNQSSQFLLTEKPEVCHFTGSSWHPCTVGS